MTEMPSKFQRDQGMPSYRFLTTRSVTGGSISSPAGLLPLRTSSMVGVIPEHPYEDAVDSASMTEVRLDSRWHDRGWRRPEILPR